MAIKFFAFFFSDNQYFRMFLVSMPLLCEPNDAVRAVAVAKRREYNIAFCYAFYTLHCITTLHCTTLHCIALDYITLHCMHACIHTYVIIHRYRRFKRFEVKSMCTCRRDMQCCILACGTVVTAHAFEQPTKQSSGSKHEPRSI